MIEIAATVHANSLWNEAGKKQGHCDISLSPTGRRMADLLATREDLATISEIHTSDLRRTCETAEPLAERLGLSIHKHPRLREGRWADYDIDPDFPPLPFHVESETAADLAKRAVSMMTDLAEKQPHGQLFIVTHGAFMRGFIRSIDPEAFERYQGTRTAINRFSYDGGVWKVVSLNDNSHLAGLDEAKTRLDAG